MRTQTYIFLQKLRCPKCGRILAGGASHKIKADKWYFYYRCENCKNNIHEDKIENKIKVLLADIIIFFISKSTHYDDTIIFLKVQTLSFYRIKVSFLLYWQ